MLGIRVVACLATALMIQPSSFHTSWVVICTQEHKVQTLELVLEVSFDF